MRMINPVKAMLLSAPILIAGAAHAAPAIEAGPRCGSGGLCFTFTAAGGLPDTVRSISFNAPSAGTVAVSMNGTMQCINNRAAPDIFGVVDLGAQITVGGAALDPTGPGGQRFAMRVPSNDGARTYSYAINLAGTRIVSVSAGATSFKYKMVINRLDEGTTCNLYSAQMSVIFTP